MQQTTNFSPSQSGVLILACALLLLGSGMILFGPWLARRLSSGPNSGRSVLLFWAKIEFVDLIACILLFTGINAFKWIPFLPLLLKVGLIAGSSLVFSVFFSLLTWKKVESVTNVD